MRLVMGESSADYLDELIATQRSALIARRYARHPGVHGGLSNLCFGFTAPGGAMCGECRDDQDLFNTIHLRALTLKARRQISKP